MSCLPAPGGVGEQLDASSMEPVTRPSNAALDNLREDLGDEAVTRFAAHYLALLESRIAAIHQSIEHGSVEPVITLLLSLETSSHMVGARDLSQCATALRLALGQPQAETAALLEELVRAASAVRDLLAPG